MAVLMPLRTLHVEVQCEWDLSSALAERLLVKHVDPAGMDPGQGVRRYSVKVAADDKTWPRVLGSLYATPYLRYVAWEEVLTPGSKLARTAELLRIENLEEVLAADPQAAIQADDGTLLPLAVMGTIQHTWASAEVTHAAVAEARARWSAACPMALSLFRLGFLPSTLLWNRGLRILSTVPVRMTRVAFPEPMMDAMNAVTGPWPLMCMDDADVQASCIVIDNGRWVVPHGVAAALSVMFLAV